MAESKKREGVINFVLIGAKQTGKTCYIENLSKKNYIKASNDDTKEYIKSIPKKENGKHEGTSATYKELYFNYKKGVYNIDFQIDDYDGNFVQTWSSSENNKENKEKLTEYVKESEGIFVFLSYEKEGDIDTDDKFEDMRSETDTLINRIEDEYGKELSEGLPIPLIIVVSKWDDKQPFPLDENDETKRHQEEKAREYIETHGVLKEIKEKLDNWFKKIDIIPLSSEKDYNITLPIELALKYTFEAWENKIKKLQGRENEKELLIFLNSISHDILHYKNGEYIKKFNDLNEDIAPRYIKELQDLKTIKEFEEYCDEAYRNDKGESIIDAFSEKYDKDIKSIKEKLIYEEWENKIKELEGSKKKEELLIFLKTTPDDIRSYKNGEYEKKFNDLNEDIAPRYIKELQKLKSIKEFESFYNNAYKNEKGENILDAFSKKYTEQINNTKDKLEKKENKCRRSWAVSVIIVLVATAFVYSKYKLNKGEERLFHNIQTEFENKNYSATLLDIKKYYAEYNGVDKEHNENIKTLEEQAKAKYREEIDRILEKLQEIKSAVKAYGIIGEINIKAKEYETPSVKLSLIEKEFFRLNEINRAYEEANDEIGKLSLDSISKEKIDDITSNKSKLIGFTEYQILEKKFDVKIQMILNASFESDDENTLELMLDIASSMQIANDKITELKERLHKIKVGVQFNEFLEQLKKIDTIADLTNKISTDWSTEYNDNKKQVEVRNLVEIKYNEWVKNQLKRETPQSINSIDDYSRLDTFVREGINMQQRIKSMPVKISISKSVENKKVYDGKIKLFQRYKEIFENGVTTTSFTLRVKKRNSLDITSFDDKVSIYINGHKVYRPSDSHGFHRNKIVFSHRYKYKAQRYSLKIQETDLVYDDYATENFTISDNKLIELENKGHLYIKLRDGYAIEINK